jgi:hypothetical protein
MTTSPAVVGFNSRAQFQFVLLVGGSRRTRPCPECVYFLFEIEMPQSYAAAAGGSNLLWECLNRGAPLRSCSTAFEARVTRCFGIRSRLTSYADKAPVRSTRPRRI